MRSALAAPAVFFTAAMLGCASPSGSKPVNRPVTPTATAQPAPATPPARDELPDSEPLGPFAYFRMSTTAGDIIFQLDNQRAPISTANFLAHAQRGNYDGTIFHRIVAGFVVQGGGFTPDLTDRAKAEGGGVSQDKPIRNEWTNGLKNLRGTLGMARDTDPDTATREFYFNLIDNSKLDIARDGTGGAGYAVFGHVVRGMNIVDSIAAIPTHEVNPEMKNVPDDIVLVTRVRRIRPPSP